MTSTAKTPAMNFLKGMTHFAPAPSQRGMFIAYTHEKCEKCGGTIYNEAASTPNFVLNGVDTKATLIAAGLKYEHRLPPNMTVDFHDDDGGEEEWGCENCM